MSTNKTYLGYNAERLETAPAFAPYSKVIVWRDSEKSFTAGDDTGRVLEVDLPFATQTIADQMLERIRGYQYQPYYGTRAILNPAAELGDGVTVNGVYSVLASMETAFDGLMLSDVSAPEDEEVDHEYPYVSPTRRELGRKLTTAQAKTLITDELVSSPTIAGGRFMDLEQKNWVVMGQSENETIGYFHHYVDTYSDTDPLLVMGYSNPTKMYPNWVLAPFFNIALDYLLADKTMYAIGNWNFSQATVSGLSGVSAGSSLTGDKCTIEASNDVDISAGDVTRISSGDGDLILRANDGQIAMRFDVENNRISIYVDGTTFVIDSNGFHEP